MTIRQDPVSALISFIASRFDDHELPYFVRQLPDGERLMLELPGGTASRLQIADALVSALHRRGMLAREFFLALTSARPQLVDEINLLMLKYLPGPKPALQLQEGVLLGGGRYQLEELIDAGAFATLWKALDIFSTTRVAIKVLTRNTPEREYAWRRAMFIRGAGHMASVVHPNIARVLVPHMGEQGHDLCVLERIEGHSLYAAIKGRRYPTTAVVDALCGVGDGLAHLHAAGKLHGDVSPKNIMLRSLGDTLQACLVDFDLVSMTNDALLTMAATGMPGTDPFAAPEWKAQGPNLDARVDVFGLGMTAVYVYYGQTLPTSLNDPSAMDPGEFISRKLTCSHPVKSILRRACALNPQRRYGSIHEFCDAIRSLRSKRPNVPPAQTTESTSTVYARILQPRDTYHNLTPTHIFLSRGVGIPSDIYSLGCLLVWSATGGNEQLTQMSRMQSMWDPFDRGEISDGFEKFAKAVTLPQTQQDHNIRLDLYNLASRCLIRSDVSYCRTRSSRLKSPAFEIAADLTRICNAIAAMSPSAPSERAVEPEPAPSMHDALFRFMSERVESATSAPYWRPKILGMGSRAKVFLMHPPGPTLSPLAAKVYHTDDSSPAKPIFKDELMILTELGNHPNIVNFVGVIPRLSPSFVCGASDCGEVFAVELCPQCNHALCNDNAWSLYCNQGHRYHLSEDIQFLTKNRPCRHIDACALVNFTFAPCLLFERLDCNLQTFLTFAPQSSTDHQIREILRLRLRLLADIAKAMAFLHERGYVHLGIDPTNVGVRFRASRDGNVPESAVAKLIGFGHATKLTGLSVGPNSGMASFMSPEATNGYFRGPLVSFQFLDGVPKKGQICRITSLDGDCLPLEEGDHVDDTCGGRYVVLSDHEVPDAVRSL